jgi:hypothetical protein
VDVPDKSERFEFRWCHVRSKLKGGVILVKLAHQLGTVFRVVEIRSHKRSFNLLSRARQKPCLCIQNYWKVYLTYENQFEHSVNCCSSCGRASEVFEEFLVSSFRTGFGREPLERWLHCRLDLQLCICKSQSTKDSKLYTVKSKPRLSKQH